MMKDFRRRGVSGYIHIKNRKYQIWRVLWDVLII